MVTQENAGGGGVSAAASGFETGVVQDFSAVGGFAALQSDGTVITWGDSG